MNPFELMELKKSSLTKAETEVYRIFTENVDDILRETATSMAEKYSISQPAITRFCQKLGYQGYNDFKYDLYKHHKDTHGGQSMGSIIDYYCKLIHLVPGAVSEEVFSALAKQIAASRFIAVCGFHKSSLPAQLLDINLGKIGLLSSFVQQDHTMQLPQRLSKDDTVIFFSITSVIFRDVVESICEMPEGTQPATILITQNDKHPIRNKVDRVVWLPNYRNQGYPQYLESQVVPMIFVDILTNYIAHYIKEENNHDRH